MSIPQRLYRHANFPHRPIHEDVTRDRGFATADGKTYGLEISDDEEGTFELTLPSGETIKDTLSHFSNRKALYDLLDEGVFEMLTDALLDTEGEQLKEEGLQKVSYTWNNEEYVLSVNKASGMCRLTYPKRMREFYKENIYIECPDLPILYDGNLNESLRRQLKKIGVSLPDTPYQLGFRVKSKED